MNEKRHIVSEDKYKGKKLTYEEYKGSMELTWWIFDNVFKFGDNEGLNRTEGKYLAYRIYDLIKKGYTCEEILNTFKFVNIDIQYAFQYIRFEGYRHKINFIFKKIIEGIDDIRKCMNKDKGTRP